MPGCQVAVRRQQCDRKGLACCVGAGDRRHGRCGGFGRRRRNLLNEVPVVFPDLRISSASPPLVDVVARLEIAHHHVAVVRVGIGLLPRSRVRSVLIWIWALTPLTVAVGALGVTEAGQLGSSLSFVGFLVLASLLPWAGLSLLPYHLVRRLRQRQFGVGSRNGS